MAEFDAKDFFKDMPGGAGSESSGGATGIFGTVEEPAATPAPFSPSAAEAAKPVLPSVHEAKFHAPGSGDPGDTDPLHRILKSMPGSSSAPPPPPAASAPSSAGAPAGSFTQMFQALSPQAPAAPAAAEPVYTPPAPAPIFSAPSVPSKAAPAPASADGGGFTQMFESLKKPEPAA